MIRKLALACLLAGLALAAWIAAGPFLAVRAIHAAVLREDVRTLERHVDFPLVRGSVRAQLEDYIARRLQDPATPDAVRGLAAQATSALSGGVVDMLVTPAGIGAVLQGRSIVRRVMGLPPDRTPAGAVKATPAAPLASARYRFETPSRFTATVPNADGAPVVFVFARHGLRWRLVDVRLPIAALLDNLTGA